MFNSDALENKENQHECLSYTSTDLALKSSQSTSNATTYNKMTCLSEPLYNSIDVLNQNVNSTQKEHIDGCKSNLLPVDITNYGSDINLTELKQNIADDIEVDECLQNVMCKVINKMENLSKT